MYAIEGTIGAGKSFFIHALADALPYVSVALEPIHAWQRSNLGQQLLTHFYEDPQRWSYTLETYMTTCRAKEYITEQQRNLPFRIIERSIFSGHYVFAQNDLLNGTISEVEWAMYTEWFEFLMQTKCKPPLGFIYLRVTPELAHERIMKRGRSSEHKISKKYIHDVCKAYDAFLIDKTNISETIADTPVLELDFSVDIKKEPGVLKKYIQQVRDFITSTQPYKPARRLSHFPMYDAYKESCQRPR